MSGPWPRLFRLALRGHPRAWRERFGDEATRAFADGLARRWREEGPAAGRRYAVRGIVDAVAAGRRERAAARAARRAVAGPAGEGPSGALWADVRYAVRRLRRAPGLTASVVGILALGVGANAAVFSVLRSAVLAPLPFPEAERLVLPRWTTTAAGVPDTAFGQWSYPKFAEFREGTDGVFDAFVAYARRSAAVTDPGDAASVPFEFVSPGYFELLGASPAAGRFFTGDEGGPEPSGVVVLSHAFWVERFGGDPAVVGRTITADGSRLEVVGVAPEGFEGLTGGNRLWIPLGQAREAYGAWATEGRAMHWFHALGRLRPGITPEGAEERVAAFAREIEAVESRRAPGEVVGVDLAPLDAVWSNPNARRSVWLAMGAALLVLGIAVANVAALLLARGRREMRETAVRLALGAPRGRIVRERLVEGLLLAGGGGLLGLVLSAWVLGALAPAIPEHLFRGAGGDLLLVGTGAFGIDPTVALLGLAVALLCGAVFGAAPTLVQGGGDLVPALRRGGRRATGRSDGGRWLVGGQVAVSVVLLVGAGLLLGTLHRLHGEQRGFDPERLLVLRYSVGGPDGRYPGQDAAREFHRTFRDRVRTLPGVRSAALGSTPPLSGNFVTTHVQQVVGREPYAEEQRPRIGIHVVDGDFFATVGCRVLRGRTFTAGELERAENVVILSERAAEELFPGEEALGREIRVAFSTAGPDHPFRVVGVAEDVLYSAPTEGIGAEMYMPLGTWAPPAQSLFVRTAGEPMSVLPSARRILASLDPDVPFWQVTTGMELRGQDVADTRILVMLLGLFAGLALVLSTAGLWAVVARAVAERRREIGLRVALGARAGAVEGLVFRQGLVPVLGGGIVGVAVAALLSPGFDTLLFGVAPRSPAVFAGATGLLVVVALLATWLPARAAARIDPMEALAAD